jgi:D-sedoheptulose 7-phosphate isomerase
MKFISNYLKETASLVNLIDKKKILNIINLILEIKQKKGRIFFIGVGGSAANASHAVNDFRKICDIECYTPIDNVSELTARVNDEGWQNIFTSWLKTSKLNKNDIIFIFSVGGGNLKKKVSINIVNCIKFAKIRKTKVISCVGKSDGFAAKNSDISLIIPQVNKKMITPYSEQMQAVIWHLLVSHPKLKINKTKW